MHPKTSGGAPEDAGGSPKTEFRVLGEEMIEKEVKTSGKTGRVYLAGDWVGRLVKIIRMNGWREPLERDHHRWWGHV